MLATLLRPLSLSCVGGALLGACATPRPPPLDDQSRRVAPLPACVDYLPARRSETVGTMRSLHDDQIFKLLFPGFDSDKHLLPANAPTCTGRLVWADPALEGGAPLRPWPFLEQDGDIQYGSGGDRIKVVWLKLLVWADGTVGGPVALVRANERFADLFAIGALRGSGERTKLGTQRLGDDVVVTVEADNCSGRKPEANCESHLAIFLARGGFLKRAIDLSSERVVHVISTDKGSSGALEYRLTSTVDYKSDGVHLTEQIQASDEAGRPLRKAEVERLFSLDDRTGTLSTPEPPLWDRFVPAAAIVVEEKHETKPPRRR
jgi:hypothetical protein